VNDHIQESTAISTRKQIMKEKRKS